ncbi:MAG: prepilin-type N-terminal cleavage/methylation domain-containing protein, partial [Candidatus Cryosericum sp.]
MRRRKGFTLQELVIVVAIIAILLAIAVPRFDRYLARIRLQLAAVTLVQDLRDMQMNAEIDECFYTIVFVTNENRYYFRKGTQAWAPPGTVRTERYLSRVAGFPMAVGKRVPVSAVFGFQTSMETSVVTMSFNEMGRPAGASGGGHVTFIDPYGDRGTRRTPHLVET